MRFELKPLSFGEVIDGSFKILRGNLRFFLVTALVGGLPSIWGTAWMQAAQAQARAASIQPPGARPEMPPGFWPIMLLGIAAYFLMWGIITAGAIQLISGEETSVGKAFRRFRSVLGRALGAMVIFSIATFLYTLLLVVPGVVYALRRSLFLPVLLIENTTGPQSLDQSRTLVKGGGGRMGRLFLANLLIIGLGWALRLGLGMLIPSSLQGSIFASFLTSVPQTLLSPVTAIAIVLIYYDARVRDEGYDLELRAKEAGAVVAAGTA